MVNLGICRKCPKCATFSPAYVDDEGRKTKRSSVECALLNDVPLGWDSDVPEGCPYVLEHKMTEEAIEDLDMEGEEEADET